MSDAPDLSPREARDRWLKKISVEKRESSVSSYHYRLKLFVEWAEENGIESMQDLSGWELETYEGHRRDQGIAPITLNKEIGTVKNWLEYCARIGLVPEDLPEKVEPPDVPKDAQSSDVMLRHEDAEMLLAHYRNSPGEQGSRQHTLLEIVWSTGARIGGIHSLDVRDFNEDDEGYYLTFMNRPETGTVLKKATKGERAVGVTDIVGETIERYINHHRDDVFDGAGRQPLITSKRGRPSTGTLRNLMYLATQPCHHSPCPHGHERETCDFVEQSYASQCPSSRSPHQVRTGAITWMRHQGMPIEVVAKRVNSSVETIEKHYDKPDPIEEMRKRRAAYLDLLNFNSEEA